MSDAPTSKSLYNSNQCNGRAFEYMKKLEQQLAAAQEQHIGDLEELAYLTSGQVTLAKLHSRINEMRNLP